MRRATGKSAESLPEVSGNVRASDGVRRWADYGAMNVREKIVVIACEAT